MSKQEYETQQVSLIKHIEDLVNILQGSSVGEIELAADGTEIVIRRQQGAPETVFLPQQQTYGPQVDVKASDKASNHAMVEDRSIAILAPLTGVFYTSPSPTLPPFVQIGDIVQHEQIVGLIEAMKVFNEIPALASGRVTQIVATASVVVKKGDVLFRIEPL